ncbi:MAG TPA: DUF551 domain-containing protein [Anaerolineae bacterium]|nr:DUF551 domain-containing protein [Anaerolineae bacterium]
MAGDKWHKWPEEKPLGDGDYLCTLAGRPHVMLMEYYSKERWWLYGEFDDNLTGDITHWRPLPAPPEADRE